MNAGNFPVIATIVFIAITVLIPIVSFLFLKREYKANADVLGRKSIASIFFTEVLLWLAAVLAAGFVLMMMMGLFVYANAHAGATGNESVPIAPLLLVFGIEAGLALIGLLLHVRTSDKLWSSS
ncbi:MAG: hypothetical protein M3430_02710 [Acidobacteriota bacterium]|nr:hypothetical protein [Acidobacteriota bacterium]